MGPGQQIPGASAGEGRTRPPRSRRERHRIAATVLVVDDEEIVRRTTRAVLERKGFQVILAENGEQAVRLFREQSADTSSGSAGPDDAGDGRRGGCPLSAHDPARRPDPGLERLQRERGGAPFAGSRVAGYVRKPYTAATLLQRISAVLGMEDTAASGG